MFPSNFNRTIPIQIIFSFTFKIFVWFGKSLSQFLSALTAKESIGDHNTAIRRKIMNGNFTADPFLSPKNSTNYDERPKACKKA